MAAPSPIRSALNRRIGVNDPDADTQTPPPPEPSTDINITPQLNPFGQNIGYGQFQKNGPTTLAPSEPMAAAPPAAPPPQLADWGSVKSGNLDQAWTDFATMKYGQASRGGGFANMPTGGLQQAVTEFNQATGANARMVPGASGDLIDFGDGRGPVDVKTAEGLLWNARQGGGGAAGGGAGAGAPGGAGAGGALGAAGSAAGGVSPFSQAIRDQIMQQLTGLSKPVNENDPSIAPEMQAQERLLERNRQARRASAAERAAADGLLNGGQGSGSFESDVASGYEDKGQQLSGIQAQLFGREIQSRRDKVAQLLSMAMQSGDAESARALQFQMAQMDDQIKRLGLAQNQSQWDDSFGLQGAQFGYQKDRDLAIAGLGN
jgi:hypothetical protein